MGTTCRRLICLAVAFSMAASPALAQRLTLSSKSFTDSENGYRLKHPVDFEVTPLQPQRRAAGLVLQMEDPGGEPVGGELSVFILKQGEVGAESSTRTSIDQVLGVPPFSYRYFDKRETLLDEGLKIKRVAARHVRWKMGSFLIDTWTVHLEDYDVCMVFSVHESDDKTDAWLRLFAKSAKTFEEVEREERGTLEEAEGYEEVLAYYEAETSRTPGWHAIGTPSENSVIKTNSDNRRFIKELIERLENSRELFERDFPPPEGFDHVSVVRVCDKEAEFHKYGGTGGGVAGWFNSGTTELVLYDAVAIDRNGSFAVMTHEAFHQYCYFLFGRSEAHRWFDEGHGDYYGGFKFKGRKAQVTARMPGGLERYSRIKEMIQQGTYEPLERHLNFNHRQWQSQGPSNVSPYCQSWSIIYMLRQGQLGEVPRKMWKPEYDTIIADYVRTLNAGFARAYSDQVDEVHRLADEAGEEPSEEDLLFARTVVDEERKEEIWKEAMASSWGRIDLDEFEEHWLLYVSKHLKD